MWNRNPPINKNVSDWMWRDAVRDHEEYKRLHGGLCKIGLSPAEADAYLDTFVTLQRATEMLDPSEEDFFVDDHRPHLAAVETAIARLRQLLDVHPLEGS